MSESRKPTDSGNDHQPDAEKTAPQAAAASLAEAVDELDQVQAKLSEMHDRFLRAQAELENYRKRARRELDDERRYAEINLVRDLLPIIDNLNRAIDASEKNADPALLRSALQMMSQQFDEVLKRHHCQVIAETGVPFDPQRDEAIMQQPDDSHPEHTVLSVVRVGLRLHDRVVRPAQVIVSKRPEGNIE